MRSASVVPGAVLLSALTFPLFAVCECELGPCEEVSLQAAAAEDPESTGFAMELAPVRPAASSHVMTFELSSVDSHREEGFVVLLCLASFMVPFISLFRRLAGSTGPLMQLGLAGVARRSVVTEPVQVVPVHEKRALERSSDARGWKSLLAGLVCHAGSPNIAAAPANVEHVKCDRSPLPAA